MWFFHIKDTNSAITSSLTEKGLNSTPPTENG